MTEDQAERIAKALESIASSLVLLSHPFHRVEEDATPAHQYPSLIYRKHNERTNT